jgi:hypothetical protein
VNPHNAFYSILLKIARFIPHFAKREATAKNYVDLRRFL